MESAKNARRTLPQVQGSYSPSRHGIVKPTFRDLKRVSDRLSSVHAPHLPPTSSIPRLREGHLFPTLQASKYYLPSRSFPGLARVVSTRHCLSRYRDKQDQRAAPRDRWTIPRRLGRWI